MAGMERQPGKSMTYKEAGVDLDAGAGLVSMIRPLIRRTHTPRVLDNYGAFAGLFSLDFPQRLLRRDYRDPVLVGCTDGVGTKLKVAIAMNKVDTVGIDLVAMNVNDLVCCGAEPLFFLDYLAVGQLQPSRCAEIIKGISTGCVLSGALPLLGGETAEMPDLYKGKDFDMAGFAVGVVERRRIIDGARVEPGDCAIGLASSGLHSNGYGLARRVLLERAAYKLTDTPPELGGETVGHEMLKPTRIYAASIVALLARYKVKRPVKAMAHITGGGLPGNLPRVLPDGLTVRIKRNSWPVPPIFKLIAGQGPVDHDEMLRVFNMGVGFVLIVSPHFAKAIMNHLRRSGERCWLLGKVRKGGPELAWA